MKRDIGDIIKKSARTVSLTEAERERLERVVLGYMELKPISPRIMASTSRSFPLIHLRGTVAAVLVVALVVSGSGVALAAEGAVPGDILYAVKVNVTEEARSALASNASDRALWESQRAERRLEEAAKLALRGKLSSDKKAELAERFEKHSELALARVELSEEADATFALGLATDFESRLKAQEEFLREVDDDDRKIVEHVRKKLDRLAQVRGRVEGRLALAPQVNPVQDVALFSTAMEMAPGAPASSAKLLSASTPEVEDTGVDNEEQLRALMRMKSAARDALARAESLYEKISDTHDADYAERARVQIEAARTLIRDGDAFLSSGDARRAFDAFRISASESQRISVFLKGALELNIRRLPVLLNDPTMPTPVEEEHDGKDEVDVLDDSDDDSSGEGR